MFLMGFVKSTDHPPPDSLNWYSYLKDVTIERYLFCRTQTKQLYFFFTENKLELHGFHKFPMLLFQRERHLVVHKCFVKKIVPKNFANFIYTSRYRKPFLSSCRPRTSNFIKIEAPVLVFYCKFCEIFQNIFMQNNCEPLLLGVKRCCAK